MDLAFFGLLQGISEFLPISSSGHLFLMDQLLGQKGQSLSFILLLHFATFLSVLLVFFKELRAFCLGFFRRENSLLGLKILFSLVPLFFIGLFGRSFVEESFEKTTVALGFFSTGVLLFSLLFVPKIFPQKRDLCLDKMSFLHAFLIGLAQALAVFPGFSRSGWTISIGLYCGLSPRASVYYSFLISLPAIFGSSLVELFLQAEAGQLRGIEESFLKLFAAFVLAFISGSLSLFALLKLAGSKKLFIFSFYLIPLSLVLFLVVK